MMCLVSSEKRSGTQLYTLSATAQRTHTICLQDSREQEKINCIEIC